MQQSRWSSEALSWSVTKACRILFPFPLLLLRARYANLQGRVRFEAPFEADNCATAGGGDIPPGNGGGIFNGPTGVLIFKSEITMTECGTYVSGLYLEEAFGNRGTIIVASSV